MFHDLIRRCRAPWTAAIAASAVFFAASSPAQQLTGSISGTVTDSTGAVVPGANVTLTKVDSGEVRRTVTNAEGYFTVASLFAGSFTLTARSEGFQTAEVTDIVIGVGDNRNVGRVELQIGATAETVTVVAQANTMIPTDTGEISNTINEKQLQTLNVVGRSAAELIKILPGMAATGAGVENKPGFSGEAIGINGNGDGGKQSALGNFSANGTRPESMDIVADGAHVSDPGCNCATPINPNVDMLQEFKVFRSNYGAEHAKGPVVMSSVTKQGGQEIHGMGYFSMRDFHLNANESQLKRAGQERPENKFKFPGFNIGGPLTRGANNKAFFFFGVERFLQTIDTGVLQSVVADQAMRNGDFSNTALLSAINSNQANQLPEDPLQTALPDGSFPLFPNGIIPQNRFNPTGKILTDLTPLPTADPSAGSGVNFVQALTLDQNMWQMVGRVDYNFTEMTKLFVRYNRQTEQQNFPVMLWWRPGGAVPFPTNVVGDNVSNSFTSNFSHVLDPSTTNEVIFGLTHINFPNSFEDPQAVSRDALGIPFQGIFNNSNQHIPAFEGRAGVATMMNPGGFDPTLFAKKYLITIGDNFSKVAGRHTLKFGFFYEHIINNQPANPWSNGHIVTDIGGATSTNNALADLLLGRTFSFDESTPAVLHNMSFDTYEWYAQDSWKVHPRLTLDFGLRFAHMTPWKDREGAGMAIFDASRFDPNAPLSDFSGLRWQGIDPSLPLSGSPTKGLWISPRFGMAYDVFGTGRTVVRGGFGVFRYHDPQGPFPGAVDIPLGQRNVTVNFASTLDELENFVPQQQRVSPVTVDPNDDQQPVTYNWSLMIANRLPHQIMWEIGYVGNASRDLLNDGFTNVNLVPVGAMLNDPDADPNNFRPFPSFGSLGVIRHNLFQDYHSLQTTFSRQVGRLNVMANYTWSKVTGIRGGAQGQVGNSIDPRLNFGTLAYDRKHIFNLSYIYQFPDFAKNAGWGRLARGFLDGWQLSGITQASSGVPLQAAASANFSLSAPGINNRLIAGTPDVNVQPVLTCDPTAGLAKNQFMNGNCFALPTPGQNGDFIFPDIRGPNFQNHDISILKDWEFDDKRRLQFRAAAFNVLNRQNRSFTNGDPNLNLQFNESGQMVNDRFGFADAKIGRRIIQLTVKFYF